MSEIQTLAKLPTAVLKRLADIDRWTAEDAEDIKAAFVRALGVTLYGLLEAAAIARKASELGIDLNDCGPARGMLVHLIKIGYGQLVAEVWFNYAVYPALFKAIAGLTIPDQRVVAMNEETKVLVHGGDHLLVKPLNLTPEQIRQVFARDHIRDDSEQAAWLREQSERAPKLPQATANDPIIDKKHGGVWIGGATRLFSQRELLDLAARCAPEARPRRQRSAG